ncbi:DNA primase [Patescibacteria group bacterium]|nr:DNA primase [Patescibacteria group bacterium]MBU4057658.1 DNA primase [Patescibacteria group bacterium]MBU4115809.1 DNA primase [Patescibacteria group bacterium]
MSSDIEKIKERINIVDVIGSYIKLQKAGNNLKANCPFHSEKTPSFFVSPGRNMYHCFGCGAKGDIFTFVQEFEGLDFSGALKLLASRAGVVLKQQSKENRDEITQMFTILEEATRFFENNIKQKDGQNQESLDYLKKRGVSENTIRNFRIGFAPNSWRSLYEHLKKENFSEKMMFDVGLVRKTEKGFYDYFRNRIMFPIFDSADRVVAFSGRILSGENEKIPKYINSPETELYNKSQILYGYNKAKHSMRKNNFCILVEGQMDLILSHQSGFSNTVALSGTSLTGYHLNLIKKLTNNLIIALDSDNAGIASAKKGSEIAILAGMDVKIAELESSKDPAEIILKNKDDWRKIIKKSQHAIDFFINFIEKKNFPERKFWKEIREKILPMVGKIDNKIDQAHFIYSISSKTGIPEDSLKEELVKIKNEIYSNSEKFVQNNRGILNGTKEGGVEKLYRIDIIKRKIKGLILWQKSLQEPSINLEKIIKKFEEIVGENIFKEDSSIMPSTEQVGGDDYDLMFDTEMNYLEKEDASYEIEELLLNLAGELLKEKLKITTSEMKKAEKENNEEKVEKLLNTCSILSKEIQNKKEELLKLKRVYPKNK